MKKQIIKIALFCLAFFCFLNTAFADTTIHLNIEKPGRTIYDRDITVAPCDSDNHGTLKITAYCAILQSGIENDWNWAWAPGAFLNSLDNVAGFTTKDRDNNDVYHYWSWYLNGAEGTTGLNEYELLPNDLIALSFIDPVDPTSAPGVWGTNNTPAPSAPAAAPATPNTPSPAIASPAPAPATNTFFDTAKAFEFIISQQKADSSWGEDLYTDWVALALASGNYQEQTLKLVKYFGELKMSGTLLTDDERHAMALMALGLNPYNANGENYIEKITVQFDGRQFGDQNEDNDDIFALIVLQNAGFTQTDKMIEDDISFILSRQKTDGSWDGNADMSGAALEALSAFSSTPRVGESLRKGREFLKQNQRDNGSWGDNVSSTAWALEGILALGEKPEDWIMNGKNPLDYLATKEDVNGGIKNADPKNKIWETAYVISALSGKTWNQTMQKFNKPEEIKGQSLVISTRAVLKKPKLENLAKQLTATAINTTPPPPPTIKNETPKKSWLSRFFENIFGL